jgi:PIN domain nuclease of toxin-antitoxin system
MQSLKLLLDTHALLWAIGKTGELSETAINAIKSPDNEIMVSAVSLWEIALKHSLGKLTVDFGIEKIPEYCKEMEFELIPLEPIDALSALRLPQKKNHKDPFDRMLIYQCIKNEYILVSGDTRNKLYKDDGLKYIW